MSKFIFLCLLLVLCSLCLAQERPRLRLRPKKRVDVDDIPKEDSDSDNRGSKQLRTRNRVRVRRPPVVVEPESTEPDFSEQRFTPSRASSESERPRFIPSRGRIPSQAASSSSLPSRSQSSLAPKLSSPNPDGYKVVCYYTNWSQYRPKKGKFLPEDVDPFLCTHVIFAFGWIKDGKLTSFEAGDVANEGGKLGLYQRVIGLKSKNPKLKVLLAIGGWSFGTAKFKKMAETRFSRQTFIFSAIPFLRKYGFDGLDVDWEYPKSSDKENFVALLKELRQGFEFEAEETGNPRLELSAAVPVGPDNVRGGYDVPKVSKWLDFINLMAYDFHGKWESQAGHNAPLYAPSSDSEWRKQLSVSFAAQMWTRLGAPKNKLVIGMPTYGRSFTLADKSNYIVNSPTTGGGTAGEFTRESGFLGYYEICDMLLNGASYVWDDEMKVPYLVKDDQWVGFDDERSIRNKMDWIKTQGFAGAMIWSVDMDDFKGDICGSGVKYPLIGAIREELLGVPRETIAPGIEPSDIDWSSVATALAPVEATTLPSPTRIDINQLLKDAKVPKRVLPALLEPKLPDNLREPKVFCYYTNWSYKRPGMGQFTPEDIDPTLCTHVVFAFASIENNKLTASEDNDVGDAFTEGTYDRVMRLKEQNEKVKVLLAVGGWAFGSEPFRKLTENVFRMNGFVYDSIEFLRNMDLMDWTLIGSTHVVQTIVLPLSLSSKNSDWHLRVKLRAQTMRNCC